LRGGLAQTAPFHWSGDEASMPLLVQDVMVSRMSGSMQSDERSNALMGWLDAQKAMPAPPTNREAVNRGLALFNSSQTACSSCHSGPQGTNNTTMNVGTDGLFQVPRLVELGWRSQWFHDGRVMTPAERFGPKGGGTNHGNTANLSDTEKADLLEYLKSR
jgi:cytochrome c1